MMPGEEGLGEQVTVLLERIRRRDEAAIGQLIEQLTPTVQRYVRVRLHAAHFRAAIESEEIVQSVFKSLFVHLDLGTLRSNNEYQLLKMIRIMVRNKLAEHLRHRESPIRDHRRVVPLDLQPPPPQVCPTPSEEVSHAELLKMARDRLDSREAELVELRLNGKSWNEISTITGRTSASERQCLSRAVERICSELGLPTSAGRPIDDD